MYELIELMLFIIMKYCFQCDVMIARDVTDKHKITNLPSFVFYHGGNYLENLRFREPLEITMNLPISCFVLFSHVLLFFENGG